jgi:hypothetical protein
MSLPPGGAMVSMLESSAVERCFKTPLSQTKSIKFVLAASAAITLSII